MDKKLVADTSVQNVLTWFRQFGPTDEGYLIAHFARFTETAKFALAEKQNTHLTVLDVGAHWLHNAFFYANEGHTVICLETGSQLESESVQNVARAMAAETKRISRLDKADGIRDLATDSVDLILLCEIIEHLAFNPIRMWEQVYRVMRPGGSIIITTPNAFYGPKIEEKMAAIRNRVFGIPIEEIIGYGTFGHHWKEYSVDELKRYFAMLSPDFQIGRSVTATTRETTTVFPDESGEQIFIEVRLPAKAAGIVVQPPWDVD